MEVYTRKPKTYILQKHSYIQEGKSSSGLFNQSSFIKEGSSSSNQFIKNEIINNWFDTWNQIGSYNHTTHESNLILTVHSYVCCLLKLRGSGSGSLLGVLHTCIHTHVSH